MKQLQGLSAFSEIAAAGSMAEAARRLDLTPAAVSKSLMKLEQQLGVRLIQRSTRRLRLTDEGLLFLDRARDALQVLDEAVAEISQSAIEPKGRVRISVGVAFGRNWLLPALPALSRRHPQLQIDVDLDNEPVDLVAQGYDIGIRGGRIDGGNLVARRICALPVALMASPAYLRRAGVPRTVDDLAQHQVVARRSSEGGFVDWLFLESGKGRRGARRFHQQTPSLVVNDSEAALDLALVGGGVVQAGLYHALPYLRSGRLKLLLADLHDPGRREFVLHYPHRRFLAPRVRVVVDTLLEHFKKSDDLHLMPADLPLSFRAAA